MTENKAPPEKLDLRSQDIAESKRQERLRHFPLPGKIVPGKLQRVDTPLIPPDAMREILVNALIHRDYSIAGGAISLAIFDDRVEVWSAGKYPKGITPDMLSRRHPSVQRNPIIADVFYRAGLIEKWGRGTNRVAEMCRAAGIAAPMYEEIGGSVLVTFRVRVGATARIQIPTSGSRRPESKARVWRGSQSGGHRFGCPRVPGMARPCRLDSGPVGAQGGHPETWTHVRLWRRQESHIGPAAG